MRQVSTGKFESVRYVIEKFSLAWAIILTRYVYLDYF